MADAKADQEEGAPVPVKRVDPAVRVRVDPAVGAPMTARENGY